MMATVQSSRFKVQCPGPKVGRDRRGFCTRRRRARRGHQNGFYTKIAKSRWCFCYQRQKRSPLGNWMRPDTRLFVPFATFCENGWANLGAPGGHALPQKAEFELV